MELVNEKVWTEEEEGTFRRWGNEVYEVTVQEFDGFAYIVRLDVTESLRGQGIWPAVVRAVRRVYGTVVATPESERSRLFYQIVGVEDWRGELMGQNIQSLDRGYGVFIIK